MLKERTKARITVWGFWIFLTLLIGAMSLNAFAKDKEDSKELKTAKKLLKDDTLKEDKKTTDGYIFTTDKYKGKNGEQMKLFVYKSCIDNTTQVLGDKTFKCDEKGFLKEI